MQIKFGLASILPETKVFGYIEADGEGDVVFTEADEAPVITTTHSVGPISVSETRPHDLTDIPCKRLSDLEEMYKHVKSDVAAIKEPYHHGYANGIILSFATIFGREPDFFEATSIGDHSEAPHSGVVLAYKTKHEVQSGLDRLKWATGLIRQLPKDHEGAASWLLNYAADGKSMTVPDNIAPQTGTADTDAQYWHRQYVAMVTANTMLREEIEEAQHSNDALFGKNAVLTEENRNLAQLHDGEKSRVSYLVDENIKLRDELKARPTMDYAEQLAAERDEANATVNRLRSNLSVREQGHEAHTDRLRTQIETLKKERDSAREGNSKYAVRCSSLEVDINRLENALKEARTFLTRQETHSNTWREAYEKNRSEFHAFIAAVRHVANQSPSSEVVIETPAPMPAQPWGAVPPAPIGYQPPPPPAPAPMPPEPTNPVVPPGTPGWRQY